MVYPIRVINVEHTTGNSDGSIIFHKPTTWDFHTISHTWSKGVQSWSNMIGSMLLASAAADELEGNSCMPSYEELFKTKDFSRHDCYAPFIEFLLLLQADGVRYVWLDALCINQASESGEKSQELRNMGSYYAKSKGCYVCAHGFGEGFQTWKIGPAMIGAVDDDEKTLLLPRWFSRVWTFQEVLLPRRVTFIFHLSQLLKKTINDLITDLQHKGVHGPCNCVMHGGLPLPDPCYLNADAFLDEDPSTDSDPCEMGERVEVTGADSSSACPECGGYVLIRKPSDERLQFLRCFHLPQRLRYPVCNASTPVIYDDLYFIDRECIVDLMLMAREQHMKVINPKMLLGEFTSVMDKIEDEEWKLIRLKTIMQQMRGDIGMEDAITTTAGIGVCEPVQVVLEAARRDCTRDEDRILSILGLLGVEGILQLRAGKSLEEQLLDMAQQLVRSRNVTTLVKLTMAQFVGNPAEGMSWAPTLKQGFRLTGEQIAAERLQHLPWRQRRRLERLLEVQDQVEKGSERAVGEQAFVMKYFEEGIAVDCVQEDGALRLSQAKVVWDCLFVREEGNENCFLLQVVDSHGSIVQSYAFKAYFSAVGCLLHRTAFVGGGHILANRGILTHQSIVRLQGHDLESRLVQFRVHLVLLGHLKLGLDAGHEVSMVCAGSRTGPLHKVGIIWLIPSLHNIFESLLHSNCTIGGFEDYMQRFVLTS